jgi:hypothetical protein
MQAQEINNSLLREHFVRSLEGTNNLLFYFATSAPINDKQMRFPPQLVRSLNLPSTITSMYDYRSQHSGIYDRLYQHCVISLCSDVEFMLKALFPTLHIKPESGRGFFQRFDSVISLLESKGFTFEPVAEHIDKLRLAFSVRHISIHNFGFVDRSFIERTGFSVEVGEQYLVGQEKYRDMFDGYCAFIKSLDGQITT